MSALAGVRIELASDGDELAGAARSIAATLPGPVEAIGGPLADGGAHLWVLAPGIQPEELASAASAAAPQGTAIVFAADPFADDGHAAQGATVLAFPFPVPEAELAEFDRWYDEEHVRDLLAVPGWVRIRRFALAGGPWNRLVVHDIASPETMGDPGVAAAMGTPRRASFAERPWFTAGGRAVLARL